MAENAGGAARVIELVGTCEKCKRPVYCRDGFIDGIVQPDKTVICFACSEDEAENSQRDKLLPLKAIDGSG